MGLTPPATGPTPPAPPRTAAVVVTRDAAQLLPRCLDSLAGVPLIVVVDNGSNDTAGLDERYPGVRWVRLPRNFGLTRALNIGIRAAEAAEFILLLSPEVALSAAAIDQLADTLEHESQVGAISPRVIGEPQVSDLPSPSEPNPTLRVANAGERVPSVIGQALMVRAFFLRALRHIDERYGDYGSAIEICQQVKRANKSVLIHPTVTAETASATHAEAELDREVGTARFLGKHFGFVSMAGYLAPRALGAALRFQLPRVLRLLTWKKVDGA